VRYELGRAVQVDPIKPTLKAPGTKRLKLKYDEQLSNFAFNFNLRCYSSDCFEGRACLGGTCCAISQTVGWVGYC